MSAFLSEIETRCNELGPFDESSLKNSWFNTRTEPCIYLQFKSIYLLRYPLNLNLSLSTYHNLPRQPTQIESKCGILVLLTKVQNSPYPNHNTIPIKENSIFLTQKLYLEILGLTTFTQYCTRGIANPCYHTGRFLLLILS